MGTFDNSTLLRAHILSLNCLFYICRFTRAEEMDDEVTQIFKKWKLNNPPLPKQQNGADNNSRNETFDTRTFTRPARRKTFNINDHLTSASLKSSFSMVSGTQPTNSMAEMQSMESGVSEN